MRGLYDDLPDRSHRRAIYRRCSPLYLLSHHRTGGAIPEELRPLMETVFTVAMTASLSARGIAIRNSLQKTISARVSRYTHRNSLSYSPERREVLKVTEGSAIRRIGHLRWLRNIAVALGNAHGMKRFWRRWRVAKVSTHFLMST